MAFVVLDHDDVDRLVLCHAQASFSRQHIAPAVKPGRSRPGQAPNRTLDRSAEAIGQGARMGEADPFAGLVLHAGAAEQVEDALDDPCGSMPRPLSSTS